MKKRNRGLKLMAKIYSGILIGMTFLHHPLIWHFKERATRGGYRDMLRLRSVLT